MTWTSDKPSRVGWYWWRGSTAQEHRIVHVWFSKLLAGSPRLMASNLGEVQYAKGQWSSAPIEPPSPAYTEGG